MPIDEALLQLQRNMVCAHLGFTVYVWVRVQLFGSSPYLHKQHDVLLMGLRPWLNCFGPCSRTVSA